MTDTGAVYGGALYDLAAAEGLSGEILEQLKVLETGFSQEPDFLKLLCARRLTKQERCGILEESFRDKVHPYVLNFLKILTEKGYVRRFADCARAYRTRYNEQNNILPVVAVTAVPLNPEQSARLAEKLEKITEKSIDLTNRVDPSVLGGVRLDFDGKCMDDSLAHRLESVRQLLNHTVL